jgi:hypothetical protein
MPELEGTIRRTCNLCDKVGQMRFYRKFKTKRGFVTHFYCDDCWRKKWAKKGEANPFFGKTHTKEHRDKLSRVNSVKLRGENNNMWAGSTVGYDALHNWVRRNKPKPDVCEDCHKEPPYDLANISGKYKRDIDDFAWLCRRCHMRQDGRAKRVLKNLKQFRQGKDGTQEKETKNWKRNKLL